jgi:site-specific DNA recombinase
LRIEIAGGRLVSVMDGLDTSDDQSRVIVAKLSELARSESENLGLRVRSAKMYLRSQGRWIGGQPPYGYVIRDGRLYVDPLTGPIVRECARRILEGSSIMKTVEWLNGEAIPAPRGGKWQVGSLAQLLRSPAVAGLLPETMKTQDGSHTGVVKPWRDPATGDTVSILGEAEEPLITPAEQARILERGKERAAATNWGLVGGRRSPESQHLLTGLLRCAECDFRMSKQGNSYRCQSVRLGQPCLHPGGGYQAAVDDAVTRTWMARLTTAPPDDPLLNAVKERWLAQREPEAVAEYGAILAALDRERAAVAALDDDRYIHRTIDRDRYLHLSTALAVRIERLEQLLAGHPLPEADISCLLDPVLVQELWDSATVKARRELLRLALIEVRVSQGVRGRRFDPKERLTFLWAATSNTISRETVGAEAFA